MPDLSGDARAIWQAGVDAVRSERLVRGALERHGDRLTVCGRELSLHDLGRIAVVGAGKAGAGMAAAVEEVLGDDLLDSLTIGWVNVPADCVRPLRRIHLHAARPAGVNEPTGKGVAGSRKILEIVSGLSDRDLCLVLLSGGGSALLPAPIEGLTLADKQSVTRFLMQSGATITELNTVRKHLSEIKGGKLARAIPAGHAAALIISDVVGDPLDVIASGPTVPDQSSADDALAVLRKFAAAPPKVPQAVFDVLQQQARAPKDTSPFPDRIENHIIGNNAVALDAAAAKATELSCKVRSLGSGNQGEAGELGRELAELCLATRANGTDRVCILSGGEPVVHLAKTDRPRKGGRNQQLALAALERLWNDGMEGIAILSGGTDGEDGPTDAAGACADAQVIAQARALHLDPQEFLAINDAYSFFERAGGLLKTGPTQTNVMDLRVALVSSASPGHTTGSTSLVE